MAKPNIEKIKSEIDKATSANEIFELYSELKSYATSKLEAIRSEAEEKANSIQNQIDRINGN